MANWTNSTLYNRLLEFIAHEELGDGQTIGELITALETAIVFDATNRTKVKKSSGREAFKRVRVYLSVPEGYEKERPRRIKEAENTLPGKHFTLERLSERMGGKKHD